MRVWADRAFHASLWLATALVAGALVAFATRSFLSLQDLSAPQTAAQYIDHRVLDEAEVALKTAELEKSELGLRRRVAMHDLETAYNAVRREEVALEEWVAAQKLGAQGRRHPDVVKRDKAINGLRTRELAARSAVEAIDAKLLAVEQAMVKHRRVQATENELGQQRLATAQQQRKLGALAERITLVLIGILAVCLAAAGAIGSNMAKQNRLLRAAEQERLQAQAQAQAERLAAQQAAQQRLEDEMAADPQRVLPLDVELDPEVGLFPDPPAAPAPEAPGPGAWLKRLWLALGWKRSTAPTG